MNKENVFNGHGVEVTLESPDNFLKIVETLQRIGIASKNGKTLTQSCHILHKKNHYAIMHFKELFILDGKDSTFNETDRIRRDTIAKLLENWNLLKIVDEDSLIDVKNLTSNVRIIPYKERDEWELVSKYTIGKHFSK